MGRDDMPHRTPNPLRFARKYHDSPLYGGRCHLFASPLQHAPKKGLTCNQMVPYSYYGTKQFPICDG